MRKIIYSMALLAVMSVCSSCSLLLGQQEGDKNQNQSDQTGVITISPSINLDDAVRDEARITFNHFPTNLADWQQMRAQVQDAPEGILAMQLLAFELYNNRPAEGERAVQQNSIPSAYKESMDRLPEIFGKKTGGDTQYARPYIVWSYLQGSNPDNGYTPSTPYTMIVRERMNSKQWSELAGGYVYTLEVYSDGYDTPWRAVQVIRQSGEWYIFSCPALYSQCKKSRK